LENPPVSALQNVFVSGFGFAVAFGFQQLSTETTRSY